MSPADLRALADSLEAEGIQLSADGDTHAAALKLAQAIRHRKTADELDRLQNTKHARKVSGMTAEQKADRAGAIARARTRGTRDPLQKAIQRSDWRTHNRYARERLGISPAMLTRYKAGDYPVPARIRDLIRLDFALSIGKGE